MTRGFIRVAMLATLAAALAAGVGCAKKRDRGDLMAVRSAEEMYRDGLNYLEQRNLRKAKQILQRVQYSAGNRRELEPLVRLAIADATFYQGDDLSLIDARALYQDFVTLYGDHPRAPYAQLQAGICSLAQVNHPTRDQSQTRVAIDDLREVVRRYPASPYASLARLKVREAEGLLAEHEYVIGRFYFKKKAYGAAIDRFRALLTEFPDFYEKDKVFFWMGEALLRQDNPSEARLYLERVVADYPTGEYAGRAGESLSRAGFRAAVDGAS